MRWFSFAETGQAEPDQRKLWELNSETSCDEPLNDSEYRPSFEEFRANIIEASWFDPNGQFLVADGDHWIALAAVGQVYAGTYFNLFTGVRRSHRGKGIAKALKVKLARYVQTKGGQTILTNNDSRNAPMLAVNQELGYRPQPGWIVSRKKL